MERRQFLITLAAGGLTLVAGKKAFTQTGQAENLESLNLEEDLDSFFPERVRAQDIQITIERNHGHALVLKDMDLRDGRSHSYDIRGRSTHSHIVNLSRNHFARMARGGTVRVVSSSDFGHRHIVVLRVRRLVTDDTLLSSEDGL